MSSEIDYLSQVGRDVTAIRYYTVAIGTVLFYDYLLTLADEIRYVWTEERSCAFWIFIFNRYFPMTYQIWQFAVSYSPQSKLDLEVCQRTAFYPALAFVVSTLVAQIVLTLRMYAVTMKNLPITLGFVVITVCQFALGACAVVLAAMKGAEELPAIPLEAFHVCVFVQHRTLEIAYAGISLLYDFLAFSLTIFFIMRSKKAGLKLSTILRTIAEDATRYFLFIFTSHFVLEMALSVGRESVQFLSSSASGNVIYLPVMISRLMISLRKAAHPKQVDWVPVKPPPRSGRIQSMTFYRPRRGVDPEGDDIPLSTYHEL